MLTTLVYIVLIWIRTIKNHIIVMFSKIIVHFSIFINDVFVTCHILLFWK